MKGYIHSSETFGTVDGPGIRYVLFMQGCPMRCLYCHNPDTWSLKGGKEIEPADVLREFNKNKLFYRGGGITVSGGEPLLQIDFLIELFKLAREENIHTALDTSGITYSPKNEKYMAKLDELMRYTDLVMLDIKHINDEKHKVLTSKSNAAPIGFAKYLEEKGIPLWVRYVVVKGYTDNPEDLRELGRFIGTLRNLKALDVLPYHSMGEEKYRELGIDYPLEGMPSMKNSTAATMKLYILDGIREARNQQKTLLT